MSEVLQFLENLGRHGCPVPIGDPGYEAGVSALAVDDAQRRALLDRDADALASLLGARPVMLCSIFPTEQPQRENETPDADEPDYVPQEDDPLEEER